MERCDECGYVYEDHGPMVVGGQLASISGRFRSVVGSGAVPADVLRSRPGPAVWSALEYACHVRDVLLVQRERLFLTLVEDVPGFAPMYREQRCSLARYSGEDPLAVCSDLDVAASLASRAFGGLDSSSWTRRCVYNFPEPTVRDVTWLASHTLHEAEHHLWDIGRVVSRLE